MQGHKKTVVLLSLLLIASTVMAGCHEAADGDADGDGQGVDGNGTNGTGDSGDGSGTYTLGALMVLSGDLAKLGQDTLNGAQLAVDEINADGGVDGRELRLSAMDTKLDGTEAQSGFERLAGDGVQFVLGALASGVTGAVVDKATENQIVLMSPSSTNPDLTGPDHGYFYRIIAHDGVQGPQAAELVYDDLGADRVTVMFEQTDYAQGLKDKFVPAYEDVGGSLGGEPIAWKGEDRPTHAAKAQEAVSQGAGLIWIAGQGDNLANLIKELRGQGFDGTIVTSEAVEQDTIFGVAGEDLDGVLFTKASPDFEAEAYKSFQDAYVDAFDEQPGAFSAFAYDAIHVAAAAIAEVGYDGEAIKGWLDGNSVDGRVTTPTIAFDANGDVTSGGYTLWEIYHNGADDNGFRPYQG